MSRSFLRPLVPFTILAVLLASPPSATAQEAAPPTEAQARFFEAKVRPVLVDQCFKCHGPEKQKAGLRLDSLASALAGGDTGPAVVPGNLEESMIVEALSYGEDGPRMPPSGKLPAEQVEAITQWVKMGAPWPGSDAEGRAAAPAVKEGYKIKDSDRDHWAFRPLVRPKPPAGAAPNPIDRFVLGGLQARGLEPNPPASKRDLIRRATYDLTGLPPSPEEVDNFLADEAPDAYEKLVDRLLASPRYGEKWGRHWLDLVRFAETNSYERDNPKPSAWRYRDYVIRSFNDDKPYDRFVTEQLAGDEIPDRSTETITATGYYRLGIWDDEPSDREQALYDGFDDIVATTGQVFLGLTIDCARCHDHKLDPIPQKDYYSLVAFFRNINPYRNGGPTDEHPIAEPGKEGEMADRARELEAARDRVTNEIADIEGEFQRRYVGTVGDVKTPDIQDLRYRFYRDTWEALPNFDALKYEDEGELPRGLFDLSPRTRDQAFGFVFEGQLAVPEAGSYTFHLNSDDGSRLTIAGREVILYDGIHGERKERSAVVDLPAGRVPIRLDYFQNVGGLGLTVGWEGPDLPRRSLSADPDEAPTFNLAVAIRKDGEKVLGAERFALYKNLRREAALLKRKQSSFATALCVTEHGREAPQTHILLRGNPHVPGDPVAPAFLTVLDVPEPTIPTPSAEALSSGRRTVLADWIASPSNPLTARVMANRVFQYHFGRGIARSPNNFGLQGDAPTHPELLDWLASELIEGGWRLKPLHRTIMLSDAYRRSSLSQPAALAKDPTNDGLWRFDMRRLTAEEIRDSVLAVTGKLNLKMYGPGIYPEIPEEVMAGQSMPGAGWGKSSPEEQARRSVYVHVKRSLLVPILEGFDLPETDRSSPVRFSTTQPTQALGMLNGRFLNDQAEALANRLRSEAGDDPKAQVRLALKLVAGREPSEDEIRRGTDLIAALAKREGNGPEMALADFALVALNLNEFLYLD